jgi:hypothetical protein
MRRFFGVAAVAVGAFLLAGGALLPSYVASMLVKIPNGERFEIDAEIPGATVFDLKTLSERHEVDLTSHRVINGDAASSSRDRAVFDVGLTITDHGALAAPVMIERLAMDRTTAEAVGCCGETIDGSPVIHRGLTYTFPPGTERRTYDFYDPVARRSYPAHFAGEDAVEGLSAYKFEIIADPLKIDDMAVPGSLLGSPTPEATAQRYYSSTKTVWVEPVSGLILRGQERVRQTLRDARGHDRVTLLAGTATFTPETVERQASAARRARSISTWITTSGPITLLLAGGVCLGAGLLWLRRGSPSSVEAPAAATE